MNNLSLAPVESAGIGVCALMAIFNLTRFKQRGRAAIVMALAFLCLGGTIYLFKLNAPPPQVIGGMLVTALLLGADFALRAKSSPNRGKK